MIHGLREPYNDVPNWKYGELLGGFGVGYTTKSYQVRTCKEWNKILQNKALNDASATHISHSLVLFRTSKETPEKLFVENTLR